MAREIAEKEDAQTRATNAYRGASNTIESVHQRKWFLLLDKTASGFVRTKDEDGKTKWVRGRNQTGSGGSESERLGGFEPFVVAGRDIERSLVTGRLAQDVLRDEGVVGYKGRAGWRPIVN
jgi:hypothetical protein